MTIDQVVLELDEGLPIGRIVVSDALKQDPKFRVLRKVARKTGVKLQVLTAAHFKREYPNATSGVYRETRQIRTVGLDHLIKDRRQDDILVVLDHVEDPHNVGAIMRSCECFGVRGVVVADRRASPLNESVSVGSAGASNRVQIAVVANIAQSIRAIRKSGFWIYGATDQDSQRLQPGFKLNRPACLVLGNEHKGLSRLVHNLCDDRIQIPTKGKTSSLNVSVAAGILLSWFQIPEWR